MALEEKGTGAKLFCNCEVQVGEKSERGADNWNDLVLIERAQKIENYFFIFFPQQWGRCQCFQVELLKLF